MYQSKILCISSLWLHQPVPPENKSGKGNRYYSGTKVDNPTILFGTPENACERSYCNKKEQEQLGNASTTQHESKNSKESRSADLLGVRENFITAGLPEATVQIIMSSWRTSTKNKYNIYLNKWIDYCSTRDIDPFHATIKDGLCFFMYIFECGNEYSSINSAQSALSAILPTCDGIPFGKQHLVSKFCRGVFQLRPSLPCYAFTWDTRKLLSYYRQIQENSELTLKQLTLKLATILALIMSQRAQNIHSLDINCMKIESDVITFPFPTLLKHSRPRHHLKPIPLKEYHVKKLCPVDLINTYLELIPSELGSLSYYLVIVNHTKKLLRKLFLDGLKHL